VSNDDERFMSCDVATLVAQIGAGQLAAISGGRVIARDTGITLPVGSGFQVTVDLTVDDTYTVRRVRARGSEVTIEGEQRDVYGEEVGEVAYRASCFENVEF
jgi:hypothetical protein